MRQLINEMISLIEEHNKTGAIGYSTYKALIAIVRQMQTEPM